MYLSWILLLALTCSTTCVIGFTLKTLDEGTGFHLAATHLHETSIHHFAYHNLCRTDEGKLLFLSAVKSKFCNGDKSEVFAAQLVYDLCYQRFITRSQLLLWVRELFDINGNDRISNFEKHLYSNDY